MRECRILNVKCRKQNLQYRISDRRQYVLSATSGCYGRSSEISPPAASARAIGRMGFKGPAGSSALPKLQRFQAWKKTVGNRRGGRASLFRFLR